MPFNLQTFKTRTLTAIIFAVVMLAGLFVNRWTFIVLFTIIHFGCWIEFIRVMKKIDDRRFVLYSLAGLLYITLPVFLMLSLGITIHSYTVKNTGGISYSALVPAGIIFSIWINDTMAYIVGSFFGKTPFSKISPKKTWEGTAGGAILCIAVIGLLGYIIPAARELSVGQWITIAGLSAIFGTLGDLFESKLKRMADVKDSGSFMPGHGGFLDRFDSLLLAIIPVWLYWLFFIK